ncbi:hypothetical protein [Streptomyces sp. NPDC089799]|uniref:hypothetical protein n=1 Tax=Streptomyces sp. NPDC089799 TaxID=3155066 RepID=UPI0034464BCA
MSHYQPSSGSGYPRPQQPQQPWQPQQHGPAGMPTSKKIGIGCGGLVGLLLLLAACGAIVGGDKDSKKNPKPAASVGASPTATAQTPGSAVPSTAETPGPDGSTRTPGSSRSSARTQEKRSQAPAPRTSTQAPRTKPTPTPTRDNGTSGGSGGSGGGGSAGTVTPGAYCSTQGATGRTKAGTLMRCTKKAGEARARWRAA